MFTRTEEGIKCVSVDSIPIVLLILLAIVTICFSKKDSHLFILLGIYVTVSFVLFVV